MQQIKIFCGREDGTAALERDINRWLASSRAKVVGIFGNIAPQAILRHDTGGAEGRQFAPSDVLVCVLYEAKATQARKARS